MEQSGEFMIRKNIKILRVTYLEKAEIYDTRVKTEINGSLQKILNSHAHGRTYEKGQIIYRQGETPQCFYYLLSGRASIFMNSPDGMEKTLGTAMPGEILGEAAFFDKYPRISSAVATEKSSIAVIDGGKFIELIKDYPRLALDLLESQAKRIRLLSAQIDSMTFLQADRRIAQILLEYKTTRKNKTVVLLTHEEIGSLVGASRVTVSKILNTFAKKGMIKTNYREIEILNQPQIEFFVSGR